MKQGLQKPNRVDDQDGLPAWAVMQHTVPILDTAPGEMEEKLTGSAAPRTSKHNKPHPKKTITTITQLRKELRTLGGTWQRCDLASAYGSRQHMLVEQMPHLREDTESPPLL